MPVDLATWHLPGWGALTSLFPISPPHYKHVGPICSFCRERTRSLDLIWSLDIRFNLLKKGSYAIVNLGGDTKVVRAASPICFRCLLKKLLFLSRPHSPNWVDAQLQHKSMFCSDHSFFDRGWIIESFHMNYGFTVDAQMRECAMKVKFMKGQCSSYILRLNKNRREGNTFSCSSMNSVKK